MGIPKKGERVKLKIDDLAYGGMGIGKVDEYVIFVEGALPGEEVVAEVFKRKKNYAEAKLIQVENESEFRITPRCKHFPLCGGCRLQHLDYDRQAEFKKEQLTGQLRQIGGLDNPPVSRLIKSETPFYYRNKMEYSFGVSREGQLQLGLHPRRSFGKIFQLDECYLQSEKSAELVRKIRETASGMGLPGYHVRKHTGLLRYMVIREGKNTNQRMMNIVTSESAEKQVGELCETAINDFGDIDSIVNNINTKKANIAYGEYENLIHGEPYIIENIGDIKYKISANSFFQSNSLTAVKLFNAVVEQAACNGSERVLDLYCGTGSIAFSMSRQADKLIGVDSEEAAIEDARLNSELNGITNCEFYVRDSLDYLNILIGQGERFDVIVADPPRPGLHPKMIPLLGRMASPKLIYVSCNPSALARDYAGLKEVGFKLEDVICVDMFPQTPHIEAVALFKYAQSN
ncbi:MAG: 23S rRNA (uracil(1939)-C(5))-methyltransferase RlmD [candidate division Zixibacteria bacterium]|nr:23S rRNA (uracil(1939)-C(5))-methyltransferase RlmD [candidate division Zixibacteria bacterium]